MGNEKTWRQVLDIIQQYDRPVVVVSATAKTTRQLVYAAEKALNDPEQARSIANSIRDRHEHLVTNFMANYPASQTQKQKDNCFQWIENRINELCRYLDQISESGDLSPAVKDAVASLGEQLSSRLLVYCGRIYGLDMRWFDARKIIRTNSDFGKAEPDTKLIRQSVQILDNAVKENQIPVMGGYYGEDAGGNITTLGFEGSDFTASLVGAALDASAIEIWTDVSGIFTCDPRIIPDARSIRELSYREATELAYFGAKVLHPSTMKPASVRQIPIYVKNIFEPGHPGTKIHTKSSSGYEVKALTFIENVIVITITSSDVLMGYQFLSQVFSTLENLHLPVDVVTTTEASVSVALAASELAHEAAELLKEFGDVSLVEQQALVSLIGCSFEDSDTISEKVLKSVVEGKITMISYSQSKNNLCLVLPRNKLQASVAAMHEAIYQSG